MTPAEADSRPLRRLWIAPGLAGVLLIATYFVIRIPEARQWLLELVPHRPPRSDWGTAREYLAPRCCLQAGVLGILCSIWLLWRGRRHPSTARANRKTCPTVLIHFFAWFHILLSLSTAANLVLANRRVHKTWPLKIEPDRVLQGVLGQMLTKGAALRDSPNQTGCYIIHPIGSPGAPDDRYMLHALMYPTALFAAPEPWWPASFQHEQWNAFLGTRKHRLTPTTAPPGSENLPPDFALVTFSRFIVVPCP